MSDNSNQTAGKVPAFKMPKWAWVLAVISLAVNLVVVGAAAGSLWAHRNGYWDGPRFMHRDHAFFQKLPEGRRDELRKLIGGMKKERRPLWKMVREARGVAADAMKAEPFDENALREALKNLSDAEINARKAGEESIVNLVKSLSAEEREWFAEKFKNRFRRGRRGPPPGFRRPP